MTSPATASTRMWVQDTQALLHDTREPTRRAALKAALGVGYVAAAAPVLAQTAIKTPSDGLLSGEVTIDVQGFKMPAFRSAPAGKSGLPVVLVVSDAQLMNDLDACVSWAGANGGDTSRLAITGFCWGGRVTWLYAAHQPRLKAAVSWYGRLVGQTTANNPSHPLDRVPQLKAPVLGLYAGAAAGIPLESVEQMKAALAGWRRLLAWLKRHGVA